MSSARECAMFPLGQAVLPGTVLPLHIFEPRYVQLLLDVQATSGTFGTALITRGREAGTDDDQRRADVATLVRIVEAGRVPGTDELRFAVMSVAESRLRVEQWLPDNPYPRAMVTDLDEPPAEPTHSIMVGDALALLAEVQNLRQELGVNDQGRIDDITDDPALAAFQIAAMAGIGALDAAAVLACDDLTERLTTLQDALRGSVEALLFQVGD